MFRLPDCHCLGELSRRATKATEDDVETLDKLIVKAQNSLQPLILNATAKQWKLVGISDASYDIREYEGRVGFEIRLMHEETKLDEVGKYVNLLAWGSKVLRNKVASTTSAELHAHQRVIKLMPRYISLFNALLGEHPKVEYVVDSKPLMTQLITGKSTAEPALQGILQYVIQERISQHATVLWVSTGHMTADKYTKWSL
eukprot:GHVR01174143.1.p1 GENE.GHVR01174143.1~~GHVR01174143.1.p1  ORF type:complete len:200 (+),score=13.76 GHVR01174143.1:573-1172(+)